MGRVEVEEIEEIWHGLEPPYTDLFAWLEGRSKKPEPGDVPVFRPVMLAHPIEDADLLRMDWAGASGGVEMGWYPRAARGFSAR